MQLIPAIDLLDGNCVRLRHGDFNQCQVYDFDPAALAAKYAAAGAGWIHVVDLAASRDGAQADTAPLFSLLGSCTQNVQTGGGVRVTQDVKARLDAGAARVVIGSVSGSEPERFSDWLMRFGPDCLVAALDVRIVGGVPQVRTHGWTKSSGNSLWDLLDFYQSAGLKHVLCTDIGRDGTMTGPNTDLYVELNRRHPDICVQASGGVSSLDDLRELVQTGADSAISGKALLDGKFSTEEALEVLS